jgi:hypothetical protein
MAKKFYYQVMGEIFGPMSGIELRDKAMAGDISADTLVRIDEDGNWVLAARLKNLFDDRGRAISHSAILGPPPKPPPPKQETPDPSAPPDGTPGGAMAWPPESSQREAGGMAESPSDGIDFRPDASEANTVADLPDVPAVYALYGGRGRSVYVASVGITDDLRARIEQLLVRHDATVATGSPAVSLNPDYVTEVRWWTHPSFLEQANLEAAELIAYDVLEPILSNRSGITDRAKQLYNDPAFVGRMMELIKERPAGHFVIRSLDDAWERIEAHEKRLAELERRLTELENK